MEHKVAAGLILIGAGIEIKFYDNKREVALYFKLHQRQLTC